MPRSTLPIARPGGKGQILVVKAAGGAATPLRGSDGTAPQNLDLVRKGDADLICFTGRNPGAGQPGHFSLPAAGADAPTVMAKGNPFVEPDGVAVTKGGTVYVADRAAAGSGNGRIFKVDGSTVMTLLDSLRTGNPAGVALTQDEGVLLISAIDGASGTSRVALVNLATKQSGQVAKVVSESRASGGVHRARNAGNFAWADSSAGPAGGRAFTVTLG